MQQNDIDQLKKDEPNAVVRSESIEPPAVLILNDVQNKAVRSLIKYMDNPETFNFLLLGPAGSGKTTVIVTAFNNQPINYNIAFCAFTNKATQVLKTVSDKFGLSFHAEFYTIHKLLMLEPKYLEKETEVSFKFDKSKLEHLINYDVIIFDECSTINKELYSYIVQAAEWIEFQHNKRIKYIFLGDYWQLPPVGEETSIIFNTSIEKHWPISKLTKVMRSANDAMFKINSSLLDWIPIFRNPEDEDNLPLVTKFHTKYPYNLIEARIKKYTSDLDTFLTKYIHTWHEEKNPDVVIITYSRANCEKTNFAIQDMLDAKAERDIPDKRRLICFYPGDRCCLDKPIEISTIKRNLSEGEEYITLENRTGEFLYNGEIFEIIYTESVKILTQINKEKYGNPKYFDGQILTIKRTNSSDVYDIVHIDSALVDQARKNLRTRTSRMFYLQIMSSFIKIYPKLDYGYCITLYKSQGSEWHTVLINLNSIKWSIVGGTAGAVEFTKKKALFKATYTALSRASHDLLLYWGN